jgi:ABC-type uncharacterized transport system substrate-binding protein
MRSETRRRIRTLAMAALALVLPAAAQAHPHVFVTATEEVLFGPDGLVSGVRHTWRFDDMYSAFVIQGLGPEGAILTREQLELLPFKLGHMHRSRQRRGSCGTRRV